jgi:hypothetical protein
MMSLAEKPASYFVVPDSLLLGAGNVVSVTSEAGQFPGPVSADNDNLGRLLPVQGGSLTADAVDVLYRLRAAGGVDSAEFLWRREADAATDWWGADDPQRFRGQHHPSLFGGGVVNDPGSYNSAVVYSTAFRRLLVFATPRTGTAINVRTVRILQRDVDADRYDGWTGPGLLLMDRAPPAGDHNMAAAELADGKLLLVERIANAGGSGHDFDVYTSDDGGTTWLKTAADVIERSEGTAALATHTLTSQIRLARSGEHLRLAWVEGGTTIKSAYSSDRGATWSLTSDAVAVGTSSTTDDPHPFDLVDVDSNGLFQLAYLLTATTTTMRCVYARADAGFNVVPGDIAVDGTIYQIVNVRTPSWLYIWLLYNDGSPNLAWEFVRQTPADAPSTVPALWQEAEPVSVHRAGMEYAPGRVQAAWTGNEVAFWGGSRDQATTYTDQIRGQLWYWGGWSQRSMGRHPPSYVFTDASSPVWRDFWHCGLGFPSENAGSAWTETVVATGVKISTREHTELSGGAAGDAIYYTSTTGTGVWLDGGAFYWQVRLDTGDGSAANDDIVVDVEALNGGGTASIHLTVRHSAGTLTLYDQEAAAVLATLSPTGLDSGSSGAFTEVRLWMKEDGSTALAQLIAWDNVNETWLATAVVNPTRNTGAPAATSTAIMGHLGQTQATTMRSWWRELAWTDENTSQQGGPNDDPSPAGQANPGGLFGWQTASAMPTAIEEGLTVGWAGSGGVRGDQFAGPVQHSHPAEAPLLASGPRLDWRSVTGTPGSLPNSIIILDADPVDGIGKFAHSAISMFGLNVRQVLVEYDDDVAFGSAVTAGTLNTTAFGATAFTVDRVNGSVLRVSGTPTRFTDGECAGLYIRMTSGTANGKTFKVTQHRSLRNLHCDEETVDLATQGVAAADTFVMFRPEATLVYSTPIGGSTVPPKRYMRLTFTDTDTAEDDHRLGALVPGEELTLDVPMDWAFTDNEQPNVTRYRTRSAIRWAFPEGPVQRSLVGRVVGDVTQRQRDRMRFVLRQVHYEAVPVVLVLDEDRPDVTVLGRLVSGNQQDNAAWYLDANSDKRTAGDLSVTFEEEV